MLPTQFTGSKTGPTAMECQKHLKASPKGENLTDPGFVRPANSTAIVARHKGIIAAPAWGEVGVRE